MLLFVIGRNAEMEKLIKDLREKLEREQSEKMDLSNELERSEKAGKELQQQMTSLQEQLDTALANEQMRLVETEQLTKRKVEQERSILFAEVEQERGAYQKLLQNYREMENMKGSKIDYELAPYIIVVFNNKERFTILKCCIIQMKMLISDDMEEELERLRGKAVGKSEDDVVRDHSRSESNQSSLSNTSNAPVPSEGGEEDVALILKLQQRLKLVENDKVTLEERIEELERESPTAEVCISIQFIYISDCNLETRN